MYIVSHRRKRSEGYRFHVQFLEKISPNVGRPRKFTISPSPLCPSFIEVLRQRTIERKKIHPIRNSRPLTRYADQSFGYSSPLSRRITENMPRLRNLSINRVGMEIISTSWIACNERPSAARLFRLIDFGAAFGRRNNIPMWFVNVIIGRPRTIRSRYVNSSTTKRNCPYDSKICTRGLRMHNSEIKRSRRGKKKERKEGRKISKVKLILVTRRDGFHGRQRISTLWINFERIITRWWSKREIPRHETAINNTG